MLTVLLPVALFLSSQSSSNADAPSATASSSSMLSSHKIVSSSGPSVTSSVDTTSSSASATDGGIVPSSSFSLVSSTSSLALPSADSSNPADIFTFLKVIVGAVKDKNYTLAYGVILMLLVFLLKSFVLPKISKDSSYKTWLPALSILIASIPSIAAKLMSSDVSLEEALIATLSIAMIAVGTWEFAGKPITKIINKKDTSTAEVSATTNVEEKKES